MHLTSPLATAGESQINTWGMVDWYIYVLRTFVQYHMDFNLLGLNFCKLHIFTIHVPPNSLAKAT